ncbi:MAG: tetratricopeptide repeat protein, partial [Parachlamydiaceae bacterium]
LSEEEKKSLRKKIYLSLLNAIHKNNPEDIENLKIAFDYLPEDPEQRQKVTHALSHRNINALRERRPLIGEPKSTREVKHAFDELIVLFAFLDDERLVHTKDLLQQGETLFDLEEIKQRRALLARFSPYFKENPSKAIALLELHQDNKQEILSLLIETDNKAVLNEYLSYASKSGLKINPSLDTASLFYEAETAFLDNNFEEGLFSLELLSRIDPFLRDPSLAYALALYDQEYYAAFLEEVKSIDDQTINEKRALAYIESGNREKGLEELKKIEAVSEDRSLRELAIDRLHFNDFSEGEGYLNRLKNPYDYDTALHALIKFKQNAYEEALSKVRSLNEPFRQSKAIKTIEIYSLIKLQKENEALNIAQISPQSLADNPLYEPFFNTIEKEFPLSLALSELHIKANNTDLALEELEKAPSSFKTELDKAKLYLEKGKIEEAYSSIRLAANQKPINPSKEEEALFERLYGRVFYERKEYLDAFFHFKRFYDLNIESNEDLIPRIESAIKIDRYDIAKMLSERLQDSPLKSFYRFKLDHMLDNSEERISITESALKELSDHQKKEVALIYFDRGLFSEGKRIASDLKSKALQLEIYSSIGDFRAASMLYDEVKEEKTIDAFEALALYYERTSQNQEALNALKKALELNPY